MHTQTDCHTESYRILTQNNWTKEEARECTNDSDKETQEGANSGHPFTQTHQEAKIKRFYLITPKGHLEYSTQINWFRHIRRPCSLQPLTQMPDAYYRLKTPSEPIDCRTVGQNQSSTQTNLFIFSNIYEYLLDCVCVMRIEYNIGED